MQLLNTFDCKNLSDTKRAAAYFAPLLAPATATALRGEMGAGKTTFTTFLLEEFGLTPAGSPTYAIVNEYNTAAFKICHFDFYRLENEEELDDVNFYEYLDEGAALLVEWSEKFPSIRYDYTVEIEKTGEDSRTISVYQNRT